MKRAVILIATVFISLTLAAEDKISLNMAVEKALKNNKQLQSIQAEKIIADGKKEQAKSAYFPKIKLNAGITHLSEVPDILQLTNKLVGLNNAVNAMADIQLADYTTMKNYYTGLEAANPGKYTQLVGTYTQLEANQAMVAGALEQKESYDTNLNYFGVKLNFEQPLYTGKKIKSLNKQADENQTVAELNIKIMENNLTYDVKKAYYTVLQAEEIYETAKEGLAAIEEHYREAESYYKAGFATKVDVSRADAKRSEMKQKVIAAENGVKLSKSALLFIMGEDINKKLELVRENEIKELKCESNECVEIAIKNRNELKLIDKKIKMAEYGIEIAKSEKRAIVALTGEIGEVTNRPFQKNSDDIEWQIALVGSYTIFDGGSTAGKIKEIKGSIEQAKIGKDQIKQGIEFEVKQAYLNLKNAIEAVESAKKSVIHSEETMKLAESGYRAGVTSSLEVVDANMAVVQAKNSYTIAKNQYNLAVAQLEKATGVNNWEVE